MARYTCLFTIAAPVKSLQELLCELLESCNFDIIYQVEDYLMAREVPGQIAFSKLVTVEVLIDHITNPDREVRLKLVIKNEELPLQVNNHCKRIFELVTQSIANCKQLKLIETVTG